MASLRRAASPRVLRRLALLVAPVSVAVILVAVTGALGGGSDPVRPIAVNQTDGFGNDRLLAFTYDMNYQCVHGPFDDLDNDGAVAAEDPTEFPRCIVGGQSAIDPAGDPVRSTEPLFVIVPLFQKSPPGAPAGDDGIDICPLTGGLCGALGVGPSFKPEAFDPTPDVPVQCPEPGPTLSVLKGAFGTCTMHPTALDLGPVLGALGAVPAGTPVVVPTPNHDHVIDGANFGSIWWQIITVLVLDESVWPNVEGTTGINSVRDIRTAQANGQALGDVPTNFFLHFDSRQFPQGGGSISLSHAGHNHH